MRLILNASRSSHDLQDESERHHFKRGNPSVTRGEGVDPARIVTTAQRTMGFSHGVFPIGFCPWGSIVYKAKETYNGIEILIGHSKNYPAL